MTICVTLKRSEHLILLLFFCNFLHRCTLRRPVSLECATESSEALGATCSLVASVRLNCSTASDNVLELSLEADQHGQFLGVHDTSSMRQHSIELGEALLFEQEHHVVGQNEGVTWAHVHSLFEGHLCVVKI